MTKFNVGDEIRFVENFGNYKIGEVVEITGIKNSKHIYFKGAYGKGDCYTRRVELVKLKPTKNQRITALKNELAETKNEVAELKLIVHELRDRPQLTTIVNTIQGPSTIDDVEDIIEFEGAKYKKVDCVAREGDLVVFNKIPESGIARKSVIKGKPYKVHESDGIYKKYINDEMSDRLHVYGGGVLEGTPETVDVYELIEDKPSDIFLNGNPATIEEVAELMTMPTPNELRARIIEDAKKFVEDNKSKNHTGNSKRTTIRFIENITDKLEFVVNEEKRTVVALIKGIASGDLYAKGIAKCNPSDVFNEHIGKAIALGRALNLDVSEFEQAVQPDEFVKGQIVIGGSTYKEPREVTKVKYDVHVYRKPIGGRDDDDSWCHAKRLTIINDTNAQYEVSK